MLWEEFVSIRQLLRFSASVVGNNSKIWGPLAKLAPPVWTSCVWNDNKKWPTLGILAQAKNGTQVQINTYLWLILNQTGHKTYDLYRLSETHFVCQHDAATVVIIGK